MTPSCFPFNKVRALGSLRPPNFPLILRKNQHYAMKFLTVKGHTPTGQLMRLTAHRSELLLAPARGAVLLQVRSSPFPAESNMYF